MSTNVPGQGHKGTLTFGKEATYGGGAQQLWKLDVLEFDPQPKKIEVEDASLFGEPYVRDSYLGGFSGAGMLKCKANFSGGVTELLRAALGGYSVSSPEAGVREHIYKWSDQLGSYSADWVDGDVPVGKVLRLDGMKFTGFEYAIDFMAGGMGTFSFPFLCQNLLSDQTQRVVTVASCSTTNGINTLTRATGDWNNDARAGMSVSGTNIPAGTTVTGITSATVLAMSVGATGTAAGTVTGTLTPNFPTQSPVMARMLDQTVHTDGTADAIGNIRNRSLSVSFEAPHDGDRFYGALNPDEPLRSAGTVAKFKLVQEFLTKSAFDAYKAHTSGAVKFLFKGSQIGASRFQELEFRAGTARASSLSKPVAGPGKIIQTVEWTARRDATDIATLVARLQTTEPLLT